MNANTNKTMITIADIFRSSSKIPIIPTLVIEIARLSRSEGITHELLSKKIKEEQHTSARLLRIANSPLFGRSHEIGRIEEAIQVIGLDAFTTIVVTAGVMDAVGSAPYLNMKDYWHQSLACAYWAQLLATRSKDKVDPEEAYTAAFMESLGIVIIHMTHPDLAKEISLGINPLDRDRRRIREQALLGFTYVDVTIELLSRWNLPPHLINAIKGGAASGVSNTFHEVVSLAKAVTAPNILVSGKFDDLRQHDIARLSMFSIQKPDLETTRDIIDTVVNMIISHA